MKPDAGWLLIIEAWFVDSNQMMETLMLIGPLDSVSIYFDVFAVLGVEFS